jgi:hypothetical protein
MENQTSNNSKSNQRSDFLTIQMRNIFYPNVQPKFSDDCQKIEQFAAQGFHHDEYEELEKSGMFTYKNKTYGKAEYGAQECYKAQLDFGDSITPNTYKTFFPTSWPRHKVAQVICEAVQNRVIEVFAKNPNHIKLECIGINNLILDIIVNSNNLIISAYPSLKNFK